MKICAIALLLTVLACQPALAAGDELRIETIEVKGSIVPDGTVLYNAGDGLWRNVVTLDRPAEGDYRKHYVYFTVNGDDSLKIERIHATKKLIMTGQSGKRETIRLNNGVYDITLDLNRREYSISAPVNPYRISAFGSSVANGQGAKDFRGYAYLYGKQLERRFADGESPYPFHVSGVAIGGNNTVKLIRRYDDLLNDFGHYVMIGLSLGNEGIHGAAEPEKIFEQFRVNMLALIDSIRREGKEPVVVNNYTRGDYDERDYAYIKRMNLLIHQWNVPSVNVLGAIDDGAGRWAEGYIADRSHPNTAGHEQFMSAIVPSLFDALAAHKPIPERDTTQSCELSSGRVISFTPEIGVHSFTVSVRVKGASPGRLLKFIDRSGYGFGVGCISVTDDGGFRYSSPSGDGFSVEDSALSDGDWHDVTLTHYYARGKTILYIDDLQIGELDERLQLGDIIIGDEDNPAVSRQVSEVFFWRSALNPDEIAAHHAGAMLKSSLELYSPVGRSYTTIENRAQSLNHAVFR